MPRFLVFGLVLLGFIWEAQAQQPVSRDWIFFCDKEAQAASAPPSAQAATRRATRGQADAIHLLTRPVTPAYLAGLRARGIEPHVVSTWLNAASASLTDEQRATIAALPFVCALRPVATTAPLGTSAERELLAPPLAYADAQLDYGLSATQLKTINADKALERGYNGAGVVLGFLDTEFGDFAHPAFRRMRDEGRLLGQRNFAPASQTNRHGQYVASIAVGYAEGSLIGPAWGASVLAATTEYAPSETNAEEDAFVAGMEWMEAQGADVVNISLGYTTFDAGQRSYSYADLDGDTGVTTRAADAAAALGVVVVTSAGNEGCSSPGSCWYYIGTPADADSVIAVGAIQPDSSKASFSSFGPTSDGRVKPDVAAQGTLVRFATGSSSYASGSGTSFSSPLVAGVVAQMLQANPNLTPIEVRDILRRTASQAGAPDNRLGWGIIDANRAVDEAIATNVAPGEPVSEIAVTVVPDPATGPVAFAIDGGAGTAAALNVYDVTGRRVATPFVGTLSGTTRVDLDTPLPAGLYLYRLDSAGVSVSGTFLRLR